MTLTLEQQLDKAINEETETTVRLMLLTRLANENEDQLDQSERVTLATWIAELRGNAHRYQETIRGLQATIKIRNQQAITPPVEKIVMRRTTCNPYGVVEPGDLWVSVTYTDRPDADGFYYWNVTVARVYMVNRKGHWTMIAAFEPARIEAHSGRFRTIDRAMKRAREWSAILHERYFLGMNAKREAFMQLWRAGQEPQPSE